jgi:isopenicillin-N N-acyltransferase-like protein
MLSFRRVRAEAILDAVVDSSLYVGEAAAKLGGQTVAVDPIPVVQVSGTHRQVGHQIGEAMGATLRPMVRRFREDMPRGGNWVDMLRQGRLYLEYSRGVYPEYIQELEGLAEATKVPLEELFLGMCEELWEPVAWTRGCTDLAARGRATVDGSTLLAHTNDLSPETEDNLVILRVQAGDEPEFLGVSVGGLAYSAGFNAAGIGLSGNEVSCNDIRPGVPRLLVVRAILGARRLEEAMDACLLPQRASSYNNVIADANGEVYCMEGSATDCEPIYIEKGILAHANHYVSPSMRRFETDRSTIGGSVIRYHRAMRLLRENYGQLSPELFRKLLADHANYPGSICKHGIETVTVFSLIINLNERRAWIGRGRPCRTTYVEHSLEPWDPPAQLP